ncbi:hypothetical protein DFP72DRAFT_990538 [Ephemerocybe angulata]|uniref:MOSC domain-containing protein n=1 Tax=Ephemerocybe angulata TaxID=980116 RepID=A0A8H6HYV1_9AGAR|nr:hypothetical protein DFP72DRAFT_990538 [Tulosesus angulatus]
MHVDSSKVLPAAIPAPGSVRVSKILVHPIKVRPPVILAQIRVFWQGIGLQYDRIWSIIDATTKRILTAREVPKMVLISPLIEKDESLPYHGLLNVTFPEESGLQPFSIPLQPTKDILAKWQILPQITIWPTHPPVDGYICESVSRDSPSPSDILSQYFGKSVHLVLKGPQPREIDSTEKYPDLKATAKYQDIERVGTQGISEEWATGSVVVERFRPNIVLQGGGPFAEDQWDQITIGSEDAPVLSLVSKCTRCLLPNVSPETGIRDAAVPYKVIMKFRTGLDSKEKMKPCVGCNAVPDANGRVSVGDWVYVRKLQT